MQQQRGPLVAVTGARGGCGASTLACTLALTAARRGLATLLVDDDASGGGLDLVLGLEDEPGPRWPDVRRAGLSPADLPALRLGRHRAELRVLSHARTPGSAEDAGEAVEAAAAARAGADLVVLDSPRGNDDAAPMAEADAVVLVVPAEVRSCAAAAARLAAWPGDRRVLLVVRGPAPGGLDPATVASALDLPLIAAVAYEPRLAAAVEAGRLPSLPARSTLARASARLLDALDTLEATRDPAAA